MGDLPFSEEKGEELNWGVGEERRLGERDWEAMREGGETNWSGKN